MEQEAKIVVPQQITTTQASEILKKLEHTDPIRGNQTTTDERLPYNQTNVLLMVTHPGGGTGKYYSHSRCISPTHLSVITKVFLHTGCKLRVFLPDKMGMPEETDGTVTMCRYVSNSMHETQIAFKERVNLKLFVDVPDHFVFNPGGEVDPSKLTGRVLLYSDDQADVQLLKHYLRDSDLQLAEADTLGEALDLIRSVPIDAILCGDMVQGMQANLVYSALCEVGYNSGFMVLCPTDAAVVDVIDDTPSMSLLAKPLEETNVINSLADLLGVAAGGSSDRIVSTLTNEDKNIALVEWYIDHVKCLTHSLQKALIADAVDEARQYVKTLRDTAKSYGFTQISDEAKALLKEINASGSIAECHKEVRQYINLTQKMRVM